MRLTEVTINNAVSLRWRCDSGSDYSIVSDQIYKDLRSKAHRAIPPLRVPDASLHAANATNMRIIGMFDANLSLASQT